MNRCVACGGKVVAGTAHHRVTLGAQTFSAKLPVKKCGKCGEDYTSLEVLRDFELAVARHVAEHGPVTGETFRYMRKALGLPAKKLAEVMAVPPETLSRWENGERPPNEHAWVTLGSIVLDALEGQDRTRKRLLAMRQAPLAKAVAVRPIRSVAK